MAKKEVIEVEATVTDALPNAMFRLQLANEHSVLAHVSGKIREWSDTLSGREQLAAQKFADALETIPIALAENAGMNPIDTQVNLRAKHSDGNKFHGVDAIRGGLSDMSKKNVFEPLKVKEQSLKSALEVTNMILRIDDSIASGKSAPPGPPGGGY